jgi:enoyl-CoA hydratase/carnithine racemase
MTDDEPEFSCLQLARDGAVDWLTLSRPHRLNAITGTMVSELNAYFQGLPERPQTRVVILQGAGRGFCAGMDIFESLEGDGLLQSAFEDRGTPGLEDLVKRMRACPQPIIALVNGPAAGAGLILALAADLRILSTTAVFKTAFIKLGASGCELGVSYLLPRIVGAGPAAEMIYSGRAIDAARASAMGLGSEVVPPEGLREAGAALAADLLEASPLGLRRTKETLNLCLDLASLDAVMAVEHRTQLRLAGPDHRSRLAAFAAAKARDT